MFALLAVDVVIVNPTNTIENIVEAYVTDSTVTSTGGDVSVKAESRSDVKRTLNGAVAVTIGIGGAGTGQKANATIAGTTEARIDATSDITAGDQVLVDATSDNTVSVKTFGGSGSLIAGSTIEAIGKIIRTTRAHIDDGASITAASLAVKALAKRMNVDVDTELGNVGLAGGGGSNLAQALASGDVEAWIGRKAGTTAAPKNTVIDVTGTVQITATAQETDLDADARGGSGSVIIAVTLMTGEASRQRLHARVPRRARYRDRHRCREVRRRRAHDRRRRDQHDHQRGDPAGLVRDRRLRHRSDVGQH